MEHEGAEGVGTGPEAGEPEVDERAEDPRWIKFRELANQRLRGVDERLRILGKLAQRGAYPYREEDIAKMEARLIGRVGEVMEAFRDTLAPPRREPAPADDDLF